MQRHVCRAAIAALVSVVFVGVAAAQIERNVSLINARNNTPQGANDFHLILSGINQGDLYPDGFFNSDYASPAVWTDEQGRVHIYWTQGSTPAGQWDKFGYALRGGVQYTGCEWYWTKDGVPIGDPLPDVLQDWIKVGGELRDVVRYRAPVAAAPLFVKRTSGYQPARLSSFFDIFTELTIDSPPAPVVVDPTPVTLAPNASLMYPWTLPLNLDPEYFMFYDVFSDAGSTQPIASFHNMATVIPEPGLLSLLGLSSLVALRRGRT